MEFIYKLILREDLFVEENWTESDEEIVGDHFAYLKALMQENILILAGKTDGLNENTYGIVLFVAESHEEAQKIMNNDPAITHGVMTGQLDQFSLALFNEMFTKKKDE